MDCQTLVNWSEWDPYNFGIKLKEHEENIKEWSKNGNLYIKKKYL